MFNRLNPEARIAVMQAIDEARELGHPEVGPDHVLLGLLANVRGETYALLTSHGLQFDAARTIVLDRHPAPKVSDEPTTATDASAADAAAELEEDRAALRAIGIDLDKVRDAVRATFGEDITAQWGERSRRRRGRGGPERRGGPEGRGGRGRRGPRSERFGDRLPFSESLRGAMRATVREARLGSPDSATPDEPRRGPGGGRLTAGMLLLAISRSNDPAVDAVFKWADDEATLRAAIAEQTGQPVA